MESTSPRNTLIGHSLKWRCCSLVGTTLANAPVHVEPGPRSCGRCCGEEPRPAAWTGGWGGTKEKKKRSQCYPRGASCLSSRDPDLLHHCAFSGRGCPWEISRQPGLPWFLAGATPPVLIPWPVRVGRLEWPSGRHHPDKGERHR